MSNIQEGWHGFDLDGTLAIYDGWQGEQHIGEPVPEIVALIKDMLSKGATVKIFTARVCDIASRDVEPIRKTIEDWCEKHIGVRLEVTNIKDYAMVSLFDDRAYHVIPNTGKVVSAVIADEHRKLMKLFKMFKTDDEIKAILKSMP